MTDAEKICVLREALEKIEGRDSYVDAAIRSDCPNGERKVVRGEFAEIAHRALSTTEPAPRDSSAPGDTVDDHIKREWQRLLRMRQKGGLAARLALDMAEDLEASGVTEADIDRLFPAPQPAAGEGGADEN